MAIDSSTGSGTRAREPSHDELFANMAEVRSRGVGNVEAPLDDLPALRWAARNGCPASHDEYLTDAEKIEYILRLAVSRLRGKSAQAIEALLGLSRQTRGRTVGFRRGEAVKLYGKSRETFRVRFETPLLMAVTTNLRLLVDERRLAIREARLPTFSNNDKDPSESAVRGCSYLPRRPEGPLRTPISLEEVMKLKKQRKESFWPSF